MSAATTGDAGLIVVGGGIHGAMIALAAAERGLRPLLLERDRFGAATSGNSLGIVHGGLRHLQTLDLRRHRRSARACAWMLSALPGLVEPLACLMPLYGDGLRRTAVFRLALGLHDALRPRSRLPAGRVLDRASVIDRFPAVRRTGLRGGALWFDGAFDDPAALVPDVVRRARAAGAVCLEGVEARGLLTGGGAVRGVRVLDRDGGAERTLSAPAVVNAAGPWCRAVAAAFDRDHAGLFHPVLAFNLLLDREPPASTALALFPPGGAGPALFLRACGGRLLAGTRYERWQRGPETPRPGEAAVAALLDALNAAVPALALTARDVVRVHAGLLPARAPGSAEPAGRDVLLDHGRRGGPRGLVSVSGVKLTTARVVAEQVLDRLFEPDEPRRRGMGP
ncbi:MAG TPA: FAD-dependent oxidoreductase [Azospirillum sp.]|nr:FAD-dependent oxidoreductase [Azospirillum sp.]